MSGNVRLTLSGAAATMMASLALLSAFRGGQHWLWPSVAAVALVAAGGLGLRGLGVPRLLVPVAQAAGLFWALLLLYAPNGTRWAVLPSSDSVYDLAAQVERGLEVITRYAAPVPSGPEIGLTTTIGVAVVALVVDALSATFRLVPWAGLPLLLLYSVPATTVDGTLTALAFVPAALGYLLLLVSEGRERLSGWGRSVGLGDSRSSEVAASMFGSTSRRIGATVVCLAVLLPALLPALGDGVLPEPEGSGSGMPGDQTLLVDNPMVDLRRDLRMPDNFVVMRYTTSAEDAGYIRLVTLDEFDGEAWRPSDTARPMSADGTLPPPRGLADSVPRSVETARFRISEGLRSRWLPLFYPPRRVDVQGDWAYGERSLAVRAGNGDTTTAGLEYRTSYVVPEHRGRDLRAAAEPPADIRERYTRLPDDLPERVSERAEQLTADDRTDYDAAVTLQEWFRTEFTYSLQAVPGHSGSHLLEFLDDRRGYCEQFAATMAIMARSLGIPARVAVGYQSGTPLGDSSYAVRVQDAHAWPELYFAGHGWVAFEPTPVQRTGSPPEWTSIPDETQPSAPSPTPTTDEEDEQQSPSPEPTTTSATPEADAQQGGPAGNGGGGPPLDPRPVLIALGVLAVLAAPGVARVWVRRSRLGSPPAVRSEACWRELADSARDLGTPWPPAETPRAAGTQLAESLSGPAAEEALGVLVNAVERDRYAPRPGQVSDVASAATAVIADLRTGASRSRRMAATLLPMTCLRWLGAIPRAVGWPLAAAERLGARVAGRIRSRRAL